MIFSIFEQALIMLPLICGAYITISLLKLPDLTVEGSYLCGAVAAYLAKDLPLSLVVLSSLLGGLTVGLMVTVLNRAMKIPYLLAAIVVNGFVHGVSLFLLKSSVNGFKIAMPLSEMQLLLVVAILVTGFMFLLLKSEMGFAFAIYGNNPFFFENHRIAGPYVMGVGIAIAHSLAGLSGFLFSLTSGIVDITMNFGIIMLCLTALMMGKLLRQREVPRLCVPLVGVVGYFLMQQVLLKVGLNLKYFNTFQALFILAILGMDRKKNHYTLDHLGV